MASGLDHSPSVAPFPVSLTILFVGKGKLAVWTNLSNAIRQAFRDTVQIVVASTVEDLRTGQAKDADLVFLKATSSYCSAKTRLAIREACPLASTLYVTTRVRKPLSTDLSDRETIHLAKDRPVPLEQILAAVVDAMHRRICCLKLALFAGETKTDSKPCFLEKLFLLTPQEARILASVRQGMPNKLVAKDLSITVRTVKAHLTEIFRKTESSQRAELIVKCNELAASYEASMWAPTDIKPRDQAGASPFARRAISRSAVMPSIAIARSNSPATFPSVARHQPLAER